MKTAKYEVYILGQKNYFDEIEFNEKYKFNNTTNSTFNYMLSIF